MRIFGFERPENSPVRLCKISSLRATAQPARGNPRTQAAAMDCRGSPNHIGSPRKGATHDYRPTHSSYRLPLVAGA
jgi:hypothetical protein